MLPEADPSLARLSGLMPELPSNRIRELFERLRQVGGEFDGALEQDSWLLVQRAGEPVGLEVDPTLATAIRREMAGNTSGRDLLFEGVRELQRTISNAVWRGADEYLQDFKTLGVAEHVDAIVSSVDVGYRKPNPATFEAAMAQQSVRPENASWSATQRETT